MMGGVTSITAIAIVITGIFGAILLPTFLKCIGVRNPMQMGLSIGTAAHAVGTSRAIQLGETEGCDQRSCDRRCRSADGVYCFGAVDVYVKLPPSGGGEMPVFTGGNKRGQDTRYGFRPP